MVYEIYNLTNMSGAGNQTTLLTLAQETSKQLNYFPGTLILIAIYIILLLTLKMKGVTTSASFAATSFVCMIFAIILYPMQLISGFSLVVTILLCPITLAALWIFGE